MLNMLKRLWPFVLKSTVDKIEKQHADTLFNIQKKMLQCDRDWQKMVDGLKLRHEADMVKATTDCVAVRYNRYSNSPDVAFQVELDGRVFRQVMNRTYAFSMDAEIEYIQGLLCSHLNHEIREFMVDTFRTCRFK
jgi:hypothetical protein